MRNKGYVNVNPLYATRIAHSARANLNNAVLKPSHYFDIKLDKGPKHKREGWGHTMSAKLNRLLKREQAYSDMWDSTNAQVVLHAIGPTWYPGRENPIPREVGIEDVLVPAQTLLNFSNLEFFAVYRQWTYAELWDFTHGPAVDKGWNLPMANKLLESLAQQPLQSTFMGNRWLFPEKLAEDMKENAGIFMTSAAPSIYVWDFYYRRYDEDADTEQWDRRVVLDYQQLMPEGIRAAVSKDAKENFLYEKDEYAKGREEIIHFQVGNCSNVAPFRYYSARSLGFLLFAVCQLQARLYCKFADSTFANLLELFRNVGEDDRERLEKVDLWHMGIVPDGLSFVTAAERHEVNEGQVQMMMALNQQLMSESSSTYLPEIDTGSDKEQTLGEAQLRLQTSANLSNALLNQLYGRAEHLYREQCRRFCIKGSKNRLVKLFRKQCREEGIPDEVIDVEAWEIMPNRVLGGGNKAIEGLQAEKLMAVRPLYDSVGQQEVLYRYTLANSDADLANRLVPMDEQRISDATTLATLAFGTLMEGLPVIQKRGISEFEYVKALLGLNGMILGQLEEMQEGGPNTHSERARKINGSMNAIRHTAEHLTTIQSDTSQQEQVKQLDEELRRQGSELDGYAQRLQEEVQAAAEAGPGAGDEEQAKLQAKLQAMQVEAEARARIKEADSEQKRQHKDAQWAEENSRRNATTAADVERKQALTATEVQSKLIQTQADVAAKDLTTAAEIRRPKPASGTSSAKKK